MLLCCWGMVVSPLLVSVVNLISLPKMNDNYFRMLYAITLMKKNSLSPIALIYC